MHIAVASGKGGTGKTLIAVNLAQVIPEAIYADCDVEEPNGHLFLKPVLTKNELVHLAIPKIEENRCTLCGTCMRVCQYNAIITGKKAIVFPELCHGCGSCSFHCPTQAIKETLRPIGAVSSGLYQNGLFYQGTLEIGEPMAPPVIKAVRKSILPNTHTILDAPPGTSCPMVATIKKVDYVLLVTEPTPFGLHDLILAIDTLKKLNTEHFGVVINKASNSDNLITDYCQKNNINVLTKIPHSLEIAKAYAQGKSIVAFAPYRKLFIKIYQKILWELA